MPFDPNSAEARIAELTMEVGRRWDWHADVMDSVVPGRFEIIVNGHPVGYIDTERMTIVEYKS